jgi:hypothetical protein
MCLGQAHKSMSVDRRVSRIPFPQPLQDAHIEVETVRWLWESTEEQLSELIDATIRRIAERDYPFWEENEAAILQRDHVQESMRRSARAATLLQAWAIFEDAARWAAEERRRRGRPVGSKRAGESFISWAERELLPQADTPFGASALEGLEMLCSLRNALIHTNGQYARMDRATRTRVDELALSGQSVLLREGRLDVSSAFVSGALLAVDWAIAALNNGCGDE